MHVLAKVDNKLTYRTATVEGVSAPRPKGQFGTSLYGGTPNMVVDIVTRDKTGTQDFRDVPATLSYADFDNVGIVISETIEPLVNYVTSSLKNSEEIINNIEYYQNNIVNCKDVLKQLNPDFAKREEQDEKINALSKELNDIKTGFGNMQGDIKQLISLVKGGNT